MTATSRTTTTPGRQRTEIVDVDVHERAALEELVPYLEPQWRRYITEFEWQPERLLPYAQPTAGGLDRLLWVLYIGAFLIGPETRGRRLEELDAV